MPVRLFLPTARQTNWLLIVGFLALGEAVQLLHHHKLGAVGMEHGHQLEERRPVFQFLRSANALFAEHSHNSEIVGGCILPDRRELARETVAVHLPLATHSKVRSPDLAQ